MYIGAYYICMWFYILLYVTIILFVFITHCSKQNLENLSDWFYLTNLPTNLHSLFSSCRLSVFMLCLLIYICRLL